MSMLDEYSKQLSRNLGPDADATELETRIATIQAQIEALERQLAEVEGHIETHVLELGHKVLERMRRGELHLPEVESLLPDITALEQRLLALRDEIADKEAAVARLRAATEAELPPAPAPESESAPTPMSEQPLDLRVCPECSAELYEGVTYCTSCGAKLG